MLATVPEASDACGAHHAAHPRLATSSELNGAQATAFAVCSDAAAAAVAAADDNDNNDDDDDDNNNNNNNNNDNNKKKGCGGRP